MVLFNSSTAIELSNRYQELPDHFYSRLNPDPLKDSELIAVSDSAASLIDFDGDDLWKPEHQVWLSGRVLPPGADPMALIYAGHQFGHYVPQLGDGRALLLGGIENQKGEFWELQLKGSGKTPYSRDGDGRAVLRSTIREFLCSEAMAALGIATTRALAISGSREEVYREQIEEGAMLMRLSPSHVRFGSFELFYYRQQFDQIKQLADFVIRHHYPELLQEEHPYLALLHAVIKRTATMVSQWQQVGFTHGVMNTDNMSILGLTIDYGPYGFLDTYQSRFVCNHTDRSGRYAYEQQPEVAGWNLSRLAQAILPLLETETGRGVEVANLALDSFTPQFEEHYWNAMSDKLGFKLYDRHDRKLMSDLLETMERERLDYTNTLRSLSRLDLKSGAISGMGEREQTVLQHWIKRYSERIGLERRGSEERSTEMNRHNPKYILRNYLAQQAITAAEEGDYSELKRLQQILEDPFSEQPESERYAAEPPEWSRGVMLSCSS